MHAKRPLNLADFAGQALENTDAASESSSGDSDRDSSSDASSDSEPVFSSVFLFCMYNLTRCKWLFASVFYFQECAKDVPTDVSAPCTLHPAPEEEVGFRPYLYIYRYEIGKVL